MNLLEIISDSDDNLVLRLVNFPLRPRPPWTTGYSGELPIKVPPYAILSHTWEDEQDEISYTDISGASSLMRKKAGYKKIALCALEARWRGLDYIWVDTCCIDKSNEAELDYAINHMFDWYRDANFCYVFLSDCSSSTWFSLSSKDQQATLMRCKWFSRGWTLQELLAPKHLKFYSAEGYYLGDRESFRDAISEVTKIPASALFPDTDLATFSVQDRFGWLRPRKVMREEDRAYCMLGIMKATMAIQYGEGSRSMTRLQCILDMRAIYDGADLSRRRSIETEIGSPAPMTDIIASETYRWIQNTADAPVYLFHKDRKSPSAPTCKILAVLEYPHRVRYQPRGTVVACYFCNVAGEERPTYTDVLLGLVSVFARNSPHFRKHLYDTMEDLDTMMHYNRDLIRRFRSDRDLDPTTVLEDTIVFAIQYWKSNSRRVVIVIDAIDNMMGDDGSQLITFRDRTMKEGGVKWIATTSTVDLKTHGGQYWELNHPYTRRSDSLRGWTIMDKTGHAVMPNSPGASGQRPPGSELRDNIATFASRLCELLSPGLSIDNSPESNWILETALRMFLERLQEDDESGEHTRIRQDISSHRRLAEPHYDKE